MSIDALLHAQRPASPHYAMALPCAAVVMHAVVVQHAAVVARAVVASHAAVATLANVVTSRRASGSMAEPALAWRPRLAAH